MKTIALASAAAAAFAAVQAFEVGFPNSDGGYWVTDYYNTLNWKANSSDPSFFSVQLLNANNSELNGNFQIGNALLTANGTSQIFIDQIPTGTYSVLFVNSSNYELDRPQVYYTSDPFEIRPNGTTPAPVTANTNADPESSATTSASGSATVTLTSTTGSSTPPTNRLNSSAVGVRGGPFAIFAGLISAGLGLGLGLLA